LNGTNQLLAYSDDVNVDTIKKNTEALLDAGRKVGLEVNSEKIRYMLMSRSLNARQKHGMKIANRSFEDVVSSNIQDQH
jgi:hypothetical protein